MTCVDTSVREWGDTTQRFWHDRTRQCTVSRVLDAESIPFGSKRPIHYRAEMTQRSKDVAPATGTPNKSIFQAEASRFLKIICGCIS